MILCFNAFSFKTEAQLQNVSDAWIQWAFSHLKKKPALSASHETV